MASNDKKVGGASSPFKVSIVVLKKEKNPNIEPKVIFSGHYYDFEEFMKAVGQLQFTDYDIIRIERYDW